MAFETGSATSINSLVSILRTFASANGWTVDDTTDGHAVLTKGVACVVVAFDANNLYIRNAISYSSGGNWTNQPGTTTWCKRANGYGGAIKAYWLFANADYIHMVTEQTTNVFSHLVFGTLSKFGSYTGGQYVDCSHYDISYPNFPDGHFPIFSADNNYADSNNLSGSIRLDIDGLTNNFMGFSDGSGSGAANRVKGVAQNWGDSLTGVLQHCSVNAFNQRTILVPITLTAYRGSGLYSPIGQVQDLRTVRMDQLDPGQIITLGSDDWYCFPSLQKNYTTNVSGSGQPKSSWLYGFAYKKVP